MKRFALIGALLGALVFGATTTSQAYVRPVPRVAARVVLPPYGPRVVMGPRVYGPRAYYGPRYYGPGFYGGAYRAWGPGVGVGIGVY
ncbi:MAG TPA: hypothetical protein VHC22_16645 [Pirellulales bacterium]|nr:hypothetical protein [Pirellulales bacterium]